MMDKFEIFKQLATDVSKGELAFSTGAQVALKIQKALDDPDCSIDTAARLISAEPLLAARVVAIANSVAYNPSGREVSDVRYAVTRLGFKIVRSLAMALVTRQLAGSKPSHQALVNKLWEHTAHVASLAQVIARRITHLDPEEALFAGLVHEIGGFYLISRMDDFPGLLDGGFGEWIESGEIELGRAVLSKLSVPELIRTTMEGYWEGLMAMPPVTLTDTLLLAEQISTIPSPLHHVEDVYRNSDVPGLIDMSIDTETLTSIMQESAEVLSSLDDALKF